MFVPSIIAGFDVDCNTLFIKFEKLSTVRYSDFAQIWREMKFSLIFSGRAAKELICFTTEALAYVKVFFMETNSFLRKICALYLMYGLYFKQPIRYASKILLTLNEWKEVKDFIVELKENDHTDALVILLTLILENAFEFSAANSVRYNAIPSKGLVQSNYSKFQDFGNFHVQSLLNDLEKVECDYNIAKRKMSQSGYISDLNFSCPDFTKTLQDILEGTYQNSETSEKTLPQEPVPGTSKQALENSENLGEKRRLLRKKSFQKKNKSSVYHSVFIGSSGAIKYSESDENSD